MGLLRITANGLMTMVFYLALVAGIYGVTDVLNGSRTGATVLADPVNKDPVSYRETTGGNDT